MPTLTGSLYSFSEVAEGLEPLPANFFEMEQVAFPNDGALGVMRPDAEPPLVAADEVGVEVVSL